MTRDHLPPTRPVPWGHEVPAMNAPAWRIWLVTALVIGWGILTIRFASKQEWPMALLCAVLLVSNGVTLYRLTKNGK